MLSSRALSALGRKRAPATGQVVIVLDAGTGGGRAVAVDAAGVARARSYQPWSFFEPPGLELYGREFKPDDLRRALAACCRDVVEVVGRDRVVGVTTTGMRQACLFLDAHGAPLYGGPNRDVRGVLYAAEVEEALGEERTYRLTGRWPPWLFVPSRLHWFRVEDPDREEKIAKIVMINDWIVYWLCGALVSEPTNAAESMLLDVSRGQWSDEMLEAAKIDRGLLPELAACGQVVGKVGRAAAKETFLPAGLPVLAGMADTQAALVAGGVARPGDVGIVVGSTAPVMAVIDTPRLDPEGRLWIDPHPLSGRWLAESNAGDAGIIYRGYVSGHLAAFGAAESEVYAGLEGLMAAAGPGAFGARAYLGPVIWDLKNMSTNARAGLFLSYPVGEHNSGPGVVARAILENIAFAIRANLEQTSALAGEPERVVVAGGLTRSETFLRVLASVLGRPLEVVDEPEATAVGCAALVFATLELLPPAGPEPPAPDADGLIFINPDPDDQDEYRDLYETWREEYPKMMGIAGGEDW